MIQFISVSKLYPNNFLALDNISFDINEGEFVFLIGPSGSGKTTIIRHLIREERPTEGRIYFDDNDITRFRRGKVYELRRKIGVIFQDFKLIPDKNAYENVAFAMEAAGKSTRDIKETVPYVLDIVGLSGRSEAFPEQLSGGEKQRVAIARAISNNPKLLIADEPTGNLDPDAAWDIVQILTKINNWGTTVLMSTHGSDIVDSLGKRVITLENGRVKRDAMKGKYKDDAKIEIIKTTEKPEIEKLELKIEKPDKDSKELEVITKEEEKNDEGETVVISDELVSIDENEKKEPEKKPIKEEKPKVDKKNKISEPSISLTQRQKKVSKNEEFEAKIQQKIEKKEDKKKTVNEDTDIKEVGFSPKLISILKAFGYDDLKSLKEAGYKKLSRIDELSSKDLKQINSLLKSIEDGTSID